MADCKGVDMQKSTCRVTECDGLIHHKRNQLCKKHQSRWERNGTTDTVRKPAQSQPCQVQGCDTLARSGLATLCAKHYHRQYRHGDVDKTANRTHVTASYGRRYVTIYLPNHPVSSKRGIAYQHRVVLYDTIGKGPHRCHWCNSQVRWAPKTDPQCLHVDHLNDIGDDNSPDNLVPSCGRCNSTRASQRRAKALRDHGWWSKNDTIAKLKTTRADPIIERRADA